MNENVTFEKITLYTKSEEIILEKFQTLKDLNKQKNFNLIFLVIYFAFVIRDIFKVIVCLTNNDISSVFLFLIIAIVDIFFLRYYTLQFITYYCLIEKYKTINDTLTNPLVKTCNELIDECKTLIDNNVGYYDVQKSYLNLNNFLQEYKELLPIETYNQSQKELNLISSKLIHCELKR